MSVLLNKCVSCGYVNIISIVVLGLFRTGIHHNYMHCVCSHCRCDSDNSSSFVFNNFKIMAPPILILFTGKRVLVAVVLDYYSMYLLMCRSFHTLQSIFQ